jgi:hypothetical protein
VEGAKKLEDSMIYGNLESDQSWKALRLTDLKVIRLEKQKRAEFIVLTPDR